MLWKKSHFCCINSARCAAVKERICIIQSFNPASPPLGQPTNSVLPANQRPWKFWILPAAAYTQGKIEVAENAAQGTTINNAVTTKIYFSVILKRLKKSCHLLKNFPKCVQNKYINKWKKQALKFSATNCLCLKHLGTTHNSVVAKVSVMLLAVLDVQNTQDIPVGILFGNMRNYWGEVGACTFWHRVLEPLINSEGEIAVLLLEPLGCCNWFELESTDAKIKVWHDPVAGFCPLWCLRALKLHCWPCRHPHTATVHTCCFF